MARTQELRELDTDKSSDAASLKKLRQNLNRLRREARKLDQAGVEECLSLAISLTSPRRTAS